MKISTVFRNTAKWLGFETLGRGAAALGVVSIDPNAGTSVEGDQQLIYNADGTLQKIIVTNDTGVFEQVYGYSNGRVSTISRWKKTS